MQFLFQVPASQHFSLKMVALFSLSLSLSGAALTTFPVCSCAVPFLYMCALSSDQSNMHFLGLSDK